jgi:hypothetical protein
MKERLTLKQRAFTEAYLETRNATEAADRAYKPKNRATAHAIGAENLRKPAIKGFIEESLEKSGLNIQLIAESLVEDIKNKPMNRATELLLASKLLGLLDRAKQEWGIDKRLPNPIYGGQSVTSVVVSTMPEELRKKYNLEDAS